MPPAVVEKHYYAQLQEIDGIATDIGSRRSLNRNMLDAAAEGREYSAIDLRFRPIASTPDSLVP
jgi:hypothetical protein